MKATNDTEGKTDTLIRFDWAAKRILRNKANFDVLEGFLSVLLDQEVHILEILESEGNQISPRDKYNRVDIRARLQSGEQAIIEVQNLYQMDFVQRMLYGTAKAICENLDIGDSYGKIDKIYSVAIVYFDIGDGDDYVYHGGTNLVGIHSDRELRLRKEEEGALKGTVTCKDIFPEYYLISVRDFNKLAVTPLDEWVDYLKNSRVSPTATAPGLDKVRRIMSFDSMSNAEKEEYRDYIDSVRARRDSMNRARQEGLKEGRQEGLKEGRQEGLKEGRQEGLKEGREEVARNLKALGVPYEVISRSTGLSAEELDRL